MTDAPASGERRALRGYRWQYDHIASRVYDAVLEDDLVALRLVDPDAGRVDDLLLVRRASVEGYQFKSAEFDGYVTFRRLLKEQRTRSGKPAPSLLKAIADGWSTLEARYEKPRVHLVMQQLASVNDHLGEGVDRPSPDHFSAFLRDVLEPIHSRGMALSDVPQGWRPASGRLREATGLAEGDFERFLRSLHIHLGPAPPVPSAPSTRRSDIIALSDALSRAVANASQVVELDRRGVLELMGWSDRPRLRSRHEFPVDLDTYLPLEGAANSLNDHLTRYDSGYVAVVGPPGSGKSTLLSQSLSGRSDRVIRYYAYVPGTTPSRTRLTATGFLHDAVVLLAESGLASRERQLPSQDLPGLRQQVVDQLDAAGAEFARTGRRTVLVVDGLDHVDRDHPGNDGLLGELPRPTELPDGVLVIVGTRTLAPLHPHARQQVDERGSVVDLQHHRLSPSAVMEICRRAPMTTDIPPDMHRRIAELSGGHPLALSYLLNRFRDTGEDAEHVLGTVPAYAGDIAAEYLAVWDSVVDDKEIMEILAVCSRLRIGFTTDWLLTWAHPNAVASFQQRLLYLFRRHHDGWRFFHDSFRQFASDRTARGAGLGPDGAIDAAHHGLVAELCAASQAPAFGAEETYHRYCAGQHDDVLRLAQQTTFRDQYRRLRSPDLIASDIRTALGAAADRGDVVTMLRLLLAHTELTERRSALEDIDLPGVLYAAGLVDEAIACCGGETRRVPLAHAYDLAASLGLAEDPAGRRIFDLFEHDGLDDPDRWKVSGQEDEAALAWVRAAALFRPVPTVLSAIRNVVAEGDGEPEDSHGQAERWRRYRRMVRTLVDALADRGERTSLLAVDAALVEHATELDRSAGAADDQANDVGDDQIATLVDLRVRLHARLLSSAPAAEAAEGHAQSLSSLVKGVPIFYSSMLDAAELLARHGELEVAERLLHDSPYKRAITVRALGHGGEPDVIDRHFRYWRLRLLLARRTPGNNDVEDSTPPSNATPAGDDIDRGAVVHSDADAIDLATGIDRAVRTLAHIDAANAAEEPVPVGDVWSAIVPLFDLFAPPAGRRASATYSGITRHKPALMKLIVAVVLRHGAGLPQRTVELFDGRFRDYPDRWATKLRLDLARQLRTVGLSVPWYESALAAAEFEVAAQDVYSRSEETVQLVHRYADDGDTQNARRLALAIIPMAFGVGYRKDYQFDSWVAWLGRALAEPGGGELVAEAAWMARVLTAAEPMTEGAPGSAAADLPAAVVPAGPLAAVRIFEYLVRHGTVRHLDALAALVCALARSATECAAVDVAVDLTAELIAPTSNRAYRGLAENLVSASRKVSGDSEAARIERSIADRTDRYALPTTRTEWRAGLGLPKDADQERSGVAPADDDGYSALVLSSGQRIPRSEVPSRATSAEEVALLRSAETSESHYAWGDLIDERLWTVDEVRTLAGTFGGGTRRDAEALAALAEAADRHGDTELAYRLASGVLAHASPDAWSRHYGGARRRAAALVVRLGGRDGIVAACRDLAEHVTATPWYSRLLLDELGGIIDSLAPGLPVRTTWEEARVYLEGIAETLDLPDPDVLDDHGCRWWLRAASGDHRGPSDDSGVTAALAELAVGHLSHPTWVVRDAATRVVIRGLATGNEAVGAALARFAQPDASDDILERAGRCTAASRREGTPTMACLEQLDEVLSGHRSQVLRDLASDPEDQPYRQLSPMYELSLPAQPATTVGQEPAFLFPHVGQYEMLADGLGLDIDTVSAVAATYASEARTRLPDEQAVRAALKSAQVQHTYPTERIAASRAAFGRVVADFGDARLLDGAPTQVHRGLRTVDLDLLAAAPQARPAQIPPAPEAGHDQTLDRWLREIEGRLDSYISVNSSDDRILIGARLRLTVLNWDHLEEELVCGALVGADPRTGRVLARRYSMQLRDLVEQWAPKQPRSGDSLVLENVGHTFHQITADWLSFRPEFAAALGWVPDQTRPGRWCALDGEVAVETIWWVDGWWGRTGPAFDDVEADGYAVVMTPAALKHAGDSFGPLSRHFELTRRGRHDGVEAPPVFAARTMPVKA